MKYIMKYYKIW